MLFLDKTPELGDVDMMIYKYVTANLDKVSFMRIRDLADATHVSTATILRFCRKFECSGFSEFRVRLRMYAEQANVTQVDLADETTYIDFLKRTSQIEFKSRISQAAELLKDAELVLFVGVGSSGIVAEYGALYFSSLFTLALHIEDPLNHPFNHLSKGLSGKLCIIAVSVSGETSEVIKYIQHINAHQCKILSITNSEKSTVARLSDVNIPYYIHRETYQGADITSQLPALYTVECIAREIRRKLDNEVQ
ncbi:MurR/RpiR family transcriptional regulator [Listeria rocourtiae]|uniref:MurR/RpiR family transcriptional regulator n=1 Tax=Listeria rocourtiae TaxID=647910 RepID=UPI003D2F592F